jgi:hypothetical protein
MLGAPSSPTLSEVIGAAWRAASGSPSPRPCWQCGDLVQCCADRSGPACAACRDAHAVARLAESASISEVAAAGWLALRAWEISCKAHPRAVS